MVGQTKDDQTGSAKPGITTAVAQGPWTMRGTIRCDDQTSIVAEEVDDEGSDGVLAAELGVHDLPVA